MLFEDVLAPASFVARARGLLWRKELKAHQGMLFLNCGSVHMFGMRFAIDVVFLNASWEIMSCVNGLKPWRIAACPGASSTLEIHQGMATRLKLFEGMKLECRML